MKLTGFVRRLLHDSSGQVLLFGAIILLVLFMFLLVIPNGTQVATQKVRAQTAADVGAFTGSVWLARALNLNANMNIGIRSIYTWEVVLTMGSALSQAFYTDTSDASVQDMGRGLAAALFGNNDPAYVATYVYPQAILKLDTTARWFSSLQDDVTASFGELAAAAGTEEACRNAGAYPSSDAAGGRVLVHTNDTIPLLVESPSGDSLMYADLLQLATALESIPTNDTTIGPATGTIIVDPASYEIKAYYGSAGQWATLVQRLVPGQTRVNQWYAIDPAKPDSMNHLFAAHRYFKDHKDPRVDSSCGKSWIGRGVGIWFIDSLKGRTGWRCYGKKSYSIPHPGDTVWAHQWHWRLYVPGMPIPPGETVPEAKHWLRDSGYVIDSSWADPYNTSFLTGAESTTGYQGPRVPLRRVNPDREFDAVSYVWRHGATSAPFGPGPKMGAAMFRRGEVAAQSPLFTVARSQPYLAKDNASEYDYYFTPAWDVRLAPLDSAGVAEITDDAEYGSHSQNSFNLEDMRKYVLLP